MPNEPSSLNPSLGLHEVLESEYVAFHGELPADFASQPDATIRLKALWSAIHNLKPRRAAFCISGGGIRSATFGLGILQGLARCGLLEKFHFLSTVSGGGYIGGWLSAWIHNSEDGLPEVVRQLAEPCTDARPNPEPKEIQNLRSYSNYLSPRLGLLSADSWTLAGTYLRNLFLNWWVIVPLLAAVLTLPWIYTSVLMSYPPPYTYLPLSIGAACIVPGVAYMGINLPCGGNLRWSQNRFLWFCLLPLLLASVLMTTHWAWFTYYGRHLVAWPLFGIGPAHTWVPFLYLGITIHLFSWVGSLLPSHGFRLLEFLAVIITGAIGGALLWLGATQLFPQPIAKMELYTVFGVPLFMALFFLAIMAFAGVSSRWTNDQDREWWGRATGWLIAVAIGWMVISSLVILGPYLLSISVSAIWTVVTGGTAGALTVLAGRNSSIPANAKQESEAGPFAKILSKAASLAAVIFVAVLLIFITQTLTVVMHYIGDTRHWSWNLTGKSGVLGRTLTYLNVILYTPWPAVVIMTIVLVLLGLGMAYVIDPNKFSLHAMYRDRLIRAYLGASNPRRDANPFTGFDENDNIRMREIWNEGKFGKRLMPIVNIALNLVGGSKLAWQDRKAESFTVSPLHCGSPEVGYRKTEAPLGSRYGGEKGISLGTAVAISGAAASPEHGLSLVAVRHVYSDAAECSARRVAGESGRSRQQNFSARLSKIQRWPDYRRSIWPNERHQPLRLSFGWRSLRKSWPLRNGFAPLPLHCRERRGRRSNLFVCRSRRSRAQNPHRFWNLDRVRADEHLFAHGSRRIEMHRAQLRHRPDSLFHGGWRRQRKMACSFTSSLHVTAMSRAIFTNTSRATKPFRTKAPRISFSLNRSSRAIACSACTRWRDFAPNVPATSATSCATFWRITSTKPPRCGWNA